MLGFCRNTFYGGNPNQLSIIRGDLVTIMWLDNIWFKVRNKAGKIGWVPSNCVQALISAWLMTNISRKETDKMLMSGKNYRDGHFIVRQKNRGYYTLSVRDNDTVKHLKILGSKQQLFFLYKGRKFRCIYSLVCYYLGNPMKANIRLRWHYHTAFAVRTWTTHKSTQRGDLEFDINETIHVVDWNYPKSWLGIKMSGSTKVYGAFDHNKVWIEPELIKKYRLGHVNKFEVPPPDQDAESVDDDEDDWETDGESTDDDGDSVTDDERDEDYETAEDYSEEKGTAGSDDNETADSESKYDANDIFKSKQDYDVGYEHVCDGDYEEDAKHDADEDDWEDVSNDEADEIEVNDQEEKNLDVAEA